jgi:enoyl-CoA hydratase/carnithine racemase
MSGYEFILYNVEDGIAELVLNRPEKLNAFHLPMYEEICSALASAEQDDAVRVILLRGNGRAFSAGRDFSYSSEIQQEERDAWRRRYRLFTRWTLLNNKMIVALVQGYALGGGGSLAVGSDITLAAAGTKFGYPETRHGPAGKTMIWSWAYGPKVAKETVASGRMITVEEVAHLGRRAPRGGLVAGARHRRDARRAAADRQTHGELRHPRHGADYIRRQEIRCRQRPLGRRGRCSFAVDDEHE